MTKTVMISGTSLDLPEHRKAVMDACMRHDFFPKAKEHLPPRDADAIKVSMEMVDKADVYIGIFARRYGHTPKGQKTSITEMEFDRALERGIPILVFLMHDEHPITFKMVDTSKAAQKKLDALKARASKGRVRAEFKSSEDLRSLVLHALSDLKERNPDNAFEQSSGKANPAQVRQIYLDWLRRSCENVELLGLDLNDAQNVRLGQVYVPADTRWR